MISPPLYQPSQAFVVSISQHFYSFQMRASLLFTFLLYSILISHVQGIHLKKGFQSHEDGNIQKAVVTRSRNNGANVDVISLRDEHFSGNTRKLLAKATSNLSITSSTISKNDGNRPNASPKIVGSGGKDERISINSLLGPEHSPEQYPDVTDLTRMDYSPAKRKPPIHN